MGIKDVTSLIPFGAEGGRAGARAGKVNIFILRLPKRRFDIFQFLYHPNNNLENIPYFSIDNARVIYTKKGLNS